MESPQPSGQTIHDATSVACSAATSAEYRFRSLYESIAQRCIRDFRQHDTSDHMAAGLAPFGATPDELAALRASYAEWQAFKFLWDEKLEERRFWEAHSRPMTHDDRNAERAQQAKRQLWQLLFKIVFYPLVLAAAVKVLTHAAF